MNERIQVVTHPFSGFYPLYCGTTSQFTFELVHYDCYLSDKRFLGFCGRPCDTSNGFARLPTICSSFVVSHSNIKQTLRYKMSSSRPGRFSNESKQQLQPRDGRSYHARLLEQKKEHEAKVLAAIEELLESPADQDADPLQPNEADKSHVKQLLTLFQTSDYDALIQERNIEGLCGYVLCPRKHRSENTNAKYRIVVDKNVGRGSFKVVERQELEKWCSDACGKRALYLRLQMLETPPWERNERSGTELELYSENTVEQRANPGRDDIKRLARDLGQLAFERGDKASKSFRADAVQSALVEREITEVLRSPSNTNSHAALDGYIPDQAQRVITGLRQLRLDEDDSGEDIMDTI